MDSESNKDYADMKDDSHKELEQHFDAMTNNPAQQDTVDYSNRNHSNQIKLSNTDSAYAKNLTKYNLDKNLKASPTNYIFRKNKYDHTKSELENKFLNKEFYVTFNGEQEPAKLVDYKQEEGKHWFYVDFLTLNRRWNRWFEYDDIDFKNPIDKETLNTLEWKPKKRVNVEQDEIVPYEHDEHEGMNADDLKSHLDNTKKKLVDKIQFGCYQMETWYYSPVPEKFHNCEVLIVCEYCLSFCTTELELQWHYDKCEAFHPPGNEIYRDKSRNIGVFEIDAYKKPIYCEQLGFISEMFLDHKNLFYDLTPFMFYVVCEWRGDNGYVPVGYFSKEKFSKEYNLSCIMVFPWESRKGYGKFLVAFSYELSLIDKKYGTPEKPLSDLGFMLYFSYWTQKLVIEIINFQGTVLTLESIKYRTGIIEQDSLCVLLKLNILQWRNNEYVINASKSFLKEIYMKSGNIGMEFNPKLLIYSPYTYE